MRKQFSALIVGLIVTLACGTAAAANAANARDAAQGFLEQQAALPGASIRVSITPTPAAEQACLDPKPFLPTTGQRLLGRVTVGVRCADGPPQYLEARIAARVQYWVAARNIAAGTLLTPDQMETRQGDLAQLPRQAITLQDEAVGKTTTRFLAPGAVIQSSVLRAPFAIRSHQQVDVEALGHGFRITRHGEALQNAAIGDTVRVRMNDRSVLVGVAAGASLVKIRF